MKEFEFTVYSSGLCFISVCTNLPRHRIAARANQESPTGIKSRWEISEENFKTGESNPCDCQKDPSKKHYLLVC